LIEDSAASFVGAIASYYVVTITGIECSLNVCDAETANTSDYVITIASIYGTRYAVNSYASHPLVNASDYVVTITGINDASFVVNAITKKGVLCLVLVVDTLDYVVTITGLNSASFVANASTKIVQGFILAADARDYVVTIGGIERTGVENAVFAPSASDSIVTS
jgi:hypothetical protein